MIHYSNPLVLHEKGEKKRELVSDIALDPDELAGDMLCVFYFIAHMFPNKICDEKKVEEEESVVWTRGKRGIFYYMKGNWQMNA